MKTNASFKLAMASTILGFTLFTTSLQASDSISITGDVTQDVTNLQTEDGDKSATSITGGANLSGFYFAQKNSNMRSGPGTSHGILTTLPKGSEIYVDGVEGEWYRVNYTQGQIGYIFMTLLDKNLPR